MKKKHFIIIIPLIYFLSGCYWDNEELLYPLTEEECDTANIQYSEQITDILSSYCFACHDNSSYTTAGSDILLEGYDNLINYVNNGALSGALNHEEGYSPMPKNSAKLHDCNLTIIDLWITSGSPNN
jgi:hypothetical protein